MAEYQGTDWDKHIHVGLSTVLESCFFPLIFIICTHGTVAQQIDIRMGMRLGWQLKKLSWLFC